MVQAWGLFEWSNSAPPFSCGFTNRGFLGLLLTAEGEFRAGGVDKLGQLVLVTFGGQRYPGSLRRIR